ncbi:MAG TPA: hypothetical protein VIG30_06540 [Ktedonobacterales bacterium]|jgi:hypothetical protein
MFDPRSPYHRRRWHYDSDQPLSVAQLIAAGSLDAPTAALLWLCVERHRSLIVSGPTDPTPGIGKTTTLNALLEFLPAGTTLVYTMGMYEDFDFLSQTEPPTTCVLANEVSDHLPIYMWGRVARQMLKLPADGYAIATSCHADTITDVLGILHDDLKLDQAEAGRLGIVVNIGLVGRLWPPRRRFLTAHYLRPPTNDPSADNLSVGASGGRPADAAPPSGRAKRGPRAEAVPLMQWDAASDTFTPPNAEALCLLAEGLGMTQPDLEAAIQRRTSVLQTLTAGRGASIHETRQAIEELMLAESGGASPDATDAPDADS